MVCPIARAEIAERGLSNVTVVHADALNTGLEKTSFDFVHERLGLIRRVVAQRRAVVVMGQIRGVWTRMALRPMHTEDGADCVCVINAARLKKSAGI